MGQKVNQSIFRLGVTDFNWNYKYLEKNSEESSLLLYKNNCIVNYLTNVFNYYGILIHSCKLKYTKTSLNIIIYFFYFDFKKTETLFNKKAFTSHLITKLLPFSLNLYTNLSKINIKTINLNQTFTNKANNNLEYNKTIKLLKKILNKRNYSLYKGLVKIMFISVCEKKSAQLLANCVSVYVNKYKKRHGYLLFILKKCLNILVFSDFSIIKGLKIEISGRINGAPRSKTKRIQVGSIPLQSLDSSINYHNATSYTPNGSFGIKVWICEKKYI